MVCSFLALALFMRSPDGVHALTYGAPFTLTRAEFVVSGAGHGFDKSAVRVRFIAPVWLPTATDTDLIQKENWNANL
jgi:hypothetical protein